jgi:hypothetical protein
VKLRVAHDAACAANAGNGQWTYVLQAGATPLPTWALLCIHVALGDGVPKRWRKATGVCPGSLVRRVVYSALDGFYAPDQLAGFVSRVVEAVVLLIA